MRYHLVPFVASSAFTILALATTKIPQGCTHQDGWGNAVVENKCSETVYYILDNEGTKEEIAGGSEVSIPIYEKDADKGGMSIKLFKDKDTDIWAKPAITQFEITATDLQYFDISNVNSNIGEGQNGNGEDVHHLPPFVHDGLRIRTPSPDPKEITCKAGQNPCKAAYSMWNDDWATAATKLGNDITLTICPDGKSSGGDGKNQGESSKTQPESSQQPEQSKQPEAKSEVKQEVKAAKVEHSAAKGKKEEVAKGNDDDDDDDVEVVWVTQVHTAQAAVETVYVNADEQKKAKRSEHVHQHIHNKIHKRRHAA